MTINTNEVGFVMDRIENGIGKMVENAKPIATEIIHQYVMKNFVLSGCYFLIAAIFGFFVYKCFKIVKKDELHSEDICGFIAIGTALFVILVIFALLGINCLGDAIAPIPSMLKIR